MKLSASALRIGNWIWNPVLRVPLQVDLRVLQQMHADEIYGRETFELILINEEWLERFGFKKNGDELFSPDVELRLNENTTLHYLGLKKERRFLLRFHRDEPVYAPESMSQEVPIQHVNQLQNLFHALTGEELQLKPLPSPR